MGTGGSPGGLGGLPDFLADGGGSGLGLSLSHGSTDGSFAHRVPQPELEALVQRGTCGRAVSPAEGTMLGTGVNNGADGKLPGPLPSCPRGSGPPAQPCSGGRNPAGPVSGVTAGPGRVGEAPASTSPHEQGVGGFWGGGTHVPYPSSSFPRGAVPWGARRGLGMGTARGDLYLSRALYLRRNLLRGWTLPLPFTGRDWPEQTLCPTPGGPCLERGCGVGHPQP